MPNKYQHLQQVEAEFDFHNRGPLTNSQILALAEDFIQDCVRENYRRVSIITGVGIHSTNGPVVRPMIEDFLNSHPLVEDFQPGKFTQGGQGVFVIKLNPPTRRVQ